MKEQMHLQKKIVIETELEKLLKYDYRKKQVRNT